jgi:hypothetical protein
VNSFLTHPQIPLEVRANHLVKLIAALGRVLAELSKRHAREGISFERTYPVGAGKADF